MAQASMVPYRFPWCSNEAFRSLGFNDTVCLLFAIPQISADCTILPRLITQSNKFLHLSIPTSQVCGCYNQEYQYP